MVLAIVSKKYHDPNKYLTDIYNGSMRWTGIPAIRIEGQFSPTMMRSLPLLLPGAKDQWSI